MEVIVSVLIVTQFVAIGVVAVSWHAVKCLYDETLKATRKPPQVNLDPIHAQLSEHAKMLETLRSAIVLKSAFK